MAIGTAIINVRHVKRGASGTTDLPSPTRARLVMNEVKKVSRPGNMIAPSDAFYTHVNAQIIIESEDYAALLAIMNAARIKEVCVVGYVASSGNRKLTITNVKWGELAESVFPPTEEAGNTPRYTIIGTVVAAAEDDVLSDIFVDATDT